MFTIFLVSVVIISLSGVMMPGPLFAMTVAKSYNNPTSGVLVALGHAVIEIPLIFLIYFGFANFLKLTELQIFIGVAGGAILIYMGMGMIRSRKAMVEEGKDLPYGSFTGGIITTAVNPYFLLWWASVGAALIVKSIAFGLMGFVLFTVVHWLCDFVWLSGMSLVIHRLHHLWSKRVHRAIFSLCGLLMVGFGVWFIGSVIVKL